MKAGYSFGGWADSAANATAGTVKYADEADVLSDAQAAIASADDSITLYAIWTENTYDITKTAEFTESDTNDVTVDLSQGDAGEVPGYGINNVMIGNESDEDEDVEISENGTLTISSTVFDTASAGDEVVITLTLNYTDENSDGATKTVKITVTVKEEG